MNTINRGAMDAYSKVGIESLVIDASPHKLILMLFDGAITAICLAKNHMLQNQISSKGEAISRAIAIIDEGLNYSLDVQAGGEIAQNLRELYEYMCHRLLMANINNDVEGLDEIKQLLAELRNAWELVGQQVQQVSQPVVEVPDSQRQSVSYGKA